MENKTEELRDIFLDVTDEETVTESQRGDRGSLVGGDDSADEQIQSIIEELREKFPFETDWSNEKYRTLVELFYNGTDDEAMAAQLDSTQEELFRARMDLHLLREDDPPEVAVGQAQRETIRDHPEKRPATLAEMMEIDQQAIERTRAVIDARNRSRRTSHRFQTAFEESLTDAELTSQFAADTRDDGLDEATAGAEVDVDF